MGIAVAFDRGGWDELRMTTTCPNCQQDATVDAPGDVVCPSCGAAFSWGEMPKSSPPKVPSWLRMPVPPSAPPKSVPEPPPLRVVVVDFDMSIMSMVGIMVKAAIAAIPAAVIIAGLVLLFSALMQAIRG